MKDSNYTVIQGWMVNSLKLSGNELMAYAVIYGFSQDKKSGYEGGGKYLRLSCGVSSRALTNILNSLLKKKYVLKEYFINADNNVGYCRYKTNPDFVPKEYKKEQKKELEKEESSAEGMAENAMGYGKNCHSGMANSAVKHGKFCRRGMANSANNTSSDINLNTSSSGQPDSDAAPAPQDKTAEEENMPSSFSEDELKNALLSVDKTLFLDNFFPQAAAFMSKHNLDKNYFAFIHGETCNTNYKSFKAMYYTLFFKDSKAEEYKALNKPPLPAQPPPPDDIKCPVCGTVHDKNAETCPDCYLPRDPTPEMISLFRELLSFSAGRRDEYLKRENVIYSEFKGDFVKIKTMVDSLKKEFGLEAGHEEPSRSCHP